MMEETSAYLLAVAQGVTDSFSGRPHPEQVRPILENLWNEAGLSAGQVQEIQWLGGDEEYWLGALDESFGFSADTARFHWPVTPLLPHVMLQASARTIEAGQRELVLLAQETGGQAVILLLASPAIARSQGTAPRARIGLKLALSSKPDGLLKAAREAWEKSGREPGDVRWLTSARRPANPSATPFSAARWLDVDRKLPTGDLFMLAALAKRLAEGDSGAGLLYSDGQAKSGLVTFLERA
jgi:hypothetical protein